MSGTNPEGDRGRAARTSSATDGANVEKRRSEGVRERESARAAAEKDGRGKDERGANRENERKRERIERPRI